MADLTKCFAAALKQGVISQDEHDSLVKRATALQGEGMQPDRVKQTIAKELEGEAAERKRRALLAEGKLKSALDAMRGYTNRKGESDLIEAFIGLHEKLGRDGGSPLDDAETKREVIRRAVHGRLADLMIEFKKGLITGDLRRRRKAVAARADNIVREMHGEASGDETAKALADALRVEMEALRVRFNEAGGGVGKLDNWFPHSHDQQALLDAGRSSWVDYMMGQGVLDRDRTVHPVTKRRLTDDEMRDSLSVIWDRITSDGWVDREVTGAMMGRGEIWSQHADHRFLHYKNADAWLAYAKKFGNPDPFSAIVHHINTMARDIAHMETWGPDPQVTRTYVKNLLQQQVSLMRPTEIIIKEQVAQLKELQGKLAAPNPDYVALSDRIGAIHTEIDAIRRKHTPQLGGKPSKRNAAKLEALDQELMDLTQKIMPYWNDPKLQRIEDQETRVKMSKLLDSMRDPIVLTKRKRPQDYLNSKLDLADAMWEMQRGSLTPVSATMANVFASIRNVVSASSLGAAWLSSLSDPAFGQDMRVRFGIGMGKANFGRVGALVLKDMITKGNRLDAVRMGLGLDSAIDVMHRTAKENRTIDGRAWTGFVADRVLAISGLTPWTQAGKHLAGMDLMGFLADVSNKNWTALGLQTQKALSAHGIDAPSWEIIRKSDKYEPREGARFLRAAEIEASAGRELAERYAAMILREVRYAVPESSVQARALWMGGMKPGTLRGELWRSMMQFKGFGMTVMMLHTQRIARDIISRNPTATGHAAALLITSAFLGAIAMSLKDMKDGRDPRKWMDEKTYLDPAFWSAALLQAGGLGIYGDFAFSQTGRHGQSLSKTIAGPLTDRLDNLLALTTGNLFQAYRGEKTNIGREAVRALRQNTPGANIWMIGLPLQRLVFDELQKLADPQAYAAFAREEQLRRKDYGQSYYWPPGRQSPSRAPDLSRLGATR